MWTQNFYVIRVAYINNAMDHLTNGEGSMITLTMISCTRQHVLGGPKCLQSSEDIFEMVLL